MKKPLPILWGTILCVLFSCSNEENFIVPEPEIPETRVSIEDAISAVDNLLDFLDGHRTRSGLSKRTVSEYFLLGETAATRSADAGDDAEGMFYLLNFANDEGFAIVGADTRLPTDVFAITESGNIDPEEGIDNPGLALFLATLGEASVGGDGDSGGGDLGVILDPVAPSFGPNPTIESEYSDWVNSTYSGLKSGTKWYQGEPFNKYALTKNGETAAAGCVPIAVGQLMACWEYPGKMGNYLFDWSIIKEILIPTKDSQAGEMVARLLQQISTKDHLDVDFGVKESGASSKNIKRTLEAAGFSQPGTLANYESSTVENELKSGYPLMASGYSKKVKQKFLGIKYNTYYTKGHRWLIDELLVRERYKYTYLDGVLYKTEKLTSNLAYCNWGWGGWNDGYYYHEVFNASDSGGPVMTRSDEDYYYQYKIQMYSGVRR